jgi:hypothetical protein
MSSCSIHGDKTLEAWLVFLFTRPQLCYPPAKGEDDKLPWPLAPKNRSVGETGGSAPSTVKADES